MLVLEKKIYSFTPALPLPAPKDCVLQPLPCRQGIRESQAICLESARGWETTCLLVFILCTAFGEIH